MHWLLELPSAKAFLIFLIFNLVAYILDLIIFAIDYVEAYALHVGLNLSLASSERLAPRVCQGKSVDPLFIEEGKGVIFTISIESAMTAINEWPLYDNSILSAG